MTSASATLTTIEPSRMKAIVRDLQQEDMLLPLPVLLAAGLLLVLSENRYPTPLQVIYPGLVLFCIPLLAGALSRRSYRFSVWTLVLGSLLGIWLAVYWTPLPSALPFLALPAGLATLFLSTLAGIATAGCTTLFLLLAPPPFLPTDLAARLVVAMLAWSITGLTWLTRRPLATALEWSWASYEQSRTLLERARDYQVQLKQALADLADANLQLTRVNHLIQGLRQAAEEARRAKEQFVANISHELRTPLNMIIGFSETILGATGSYGNRIPPALQADLAVILRNSQHLAALIDDVLDLSQIEAGQMALAREYVALREIIEAAVTAVRPLFESKGLYLQAEIAEDVQVYCDRTRIREVVLNLLSNAGRFTEQGGVTLRAWRERNELVVSVADTGPGISTSDQKELFQPFQQADGSIRRRYGGSGLGLSISKSFVELHGGTMWLASQIGQGTTVFFRLPLEAPLTIDPGVSRWFNPYWDYEERPRKTPRPAASLRPRFVVLERGRSLHRLLSRYLDGAELVPVVSVEGALQELARAPARALLVNDSSVDDTLRRLSTAPGLPHGTPVVICSIPGTNEAAETLGVSEYLLKPVSREALLAALDRLQLKGKTILIVDDEQEAGRLFWRMLAQAERDYRVLTATNGQEAEVILRSEHPDAMILDLVMPEMDGFQLLARKKEDPELRDIPVIIVSARDPAGHPVISNVLAVACGGGLSVHQVLTCLKGLTRVLAPAGKDA